MLYDILFIILSLVLLFFGAESLVKGSSSVALRAGLSPLMVGLTIVAFGTSSPELVVSIKAAMADKGDLSVGNVVGSNSFNIGIILGITALICPITVNRQIIKIDAPIALAIACFFPLIIMDNTVSRLDGIILFTGLIGYIYFSYVLARKAPAAEQGDDDEVPKMSKHWSYDIGFILVGLAILVFGSNMLVVHSINVAKAFKVSDAVIGLTIIAAGTSMPELATSLVAAIRKQPDIAIGNVVGSNIFNIIGILGLSATIHPFTAPGIKMSDYYFMMLFSVILVGLIFFKRKPDKSGILNRFGGLILLATYGVYLYLLWPK